MLLAASPAIAAGALGLWSPWGARQQELVLDALLEFTLQLERGWFETGFLGTWEIPAALGAIAALMVLIVVLGRWLPTPLRWPLDAVEAALAALGLLGAAGLVGVGAAIDRPLFLGGIAVALLAARPREPRSPDWWAWSNGPARVVVALLSAGALVYGAASLLEGATFKNPVFRLASTWMEGPGAGPWSSGGLWLLSGVLLAAAGRALPAERRPPLPALALVGITAVASASLQPAAHLRIAGGLSALGLLAVAWAWAPAAPLRLPSASRPWTAVDPRRLARLGLPLLFWAALCAVRGLTVFMWTVPPELPAGVERLSDARCVFGLVHVPAQGTWFTDRCRVELGLLGPRGSERRWSLPEFGGQQVEELGGPHGGVVFAAVSAWTDEAQLVFLAVEGEAGPRAVSEGPGGGAEAAYIPLPACWASAWIPLESGEVLIGCENSANAEVLRPGERRLDRQVPLGQRLEAGSYDAEHHRLYGVALWEHATVSAWSWPDGEVLAQRLVGPFNWSAQHVPESGSVWVSRFLEGRVLRLAPDSLEPVGQVPLSFGIRALHHEPTRGIVWAAASYSGQLWAIDAADPDRKQALALCGQTRSLTSDAQGRLIASSDCGIFRIDPSVALGWPGP